MADPWYLQETGFSRRVAPNDMAVFMRVCPEHRYGPGETIFRDGDPATQLHVIVGGQVKLSVPTARGQERILAVLGPDDFIGETFVQEADLYRGDAVALTEVVTCPMSRAQFLQMTLRAPDFVVTFAGILASSLFHCRDQLSRSYDPVRLRVAKVLLDQTQRFGSPDGDAGWWRLDTSLRHDELASMVSATRVATTMAISELRDQGVLEGTRGSYRLNLAQLSQLSEQA
jgi:CRP/FNR family cyclic AMP-dependent transcriptional regulator